MPETKPTIKDIPAKIRTMKDESPPPKPSAVKAYRNTRVSIIQKMPKRIFVLLSISSSLPNLESYQLSFFCHKAYIIPAPMILIDITGPIPGLKKENPIPTAALIKPNRTAINTFMLLFTPLKMKFKPKPMFLYLFRVLPIIPLAFFPCPPGITYSKVNLIPLKPKGRIVEGIIEAFVNRGTAYTSFSCNELHHAGISPICHFIITIGFVFSIAAGLDYVFRILC